MSNFISNNTNDSNDQKKKLQELEDLNMQKKDKYYYTLKIAIFDHFKKPEQEEKEEEDSDAKRQHEEFLNENRKWNANIKEDSGEGAYSGIFAAFALSNLCQQQSSTDPEINELCKGLTFNMDSNKNGDANQAENTMEILFSKTDTTPEEKDKNLAKLQRDRPGELEKEVANAKSETRDKLIGMVAGSKTRLNSSVLITNLKMNGGTMKYEELKKITTKLDTIKDENGIKIDDLIQHVDFTNSPNNKIAVFITEFNATPQELCSSLKIFKNDLADYIHSIMKEKIHNLKTNKIEEFNKVLENDLNDIIFCDKFKYDLMLLIKSVLCKNYKSKNRPFDFDLKLMNHFHFYLSKKYMENQSLLSNFAILEKSFQRFYENKSKSNKNSTKNSGAGKGGNQHGGDGHNRTSRMLNKAIGAGLNENVFKKFIQDNSYAITQDFNKTFTSIKYFVEKKTI